MAVDFARLSLLADQKSKSCPPQTLTQRLQWAARRFMIRSEVWTHVQTQDVVANQNDYRITLPSTNSIIKRLVSAWYGEESKKMQIDSRIDDSDYDIFLARASVIIGDATVPSTPDPDVRGTYFDSGLSYGDEILYKYGDDEYFLWYDGTEWNISTEAGDTDESFIGAGSTIIGDYTAAGTATGAVGGTDNTGLTITFLEAYTSALSYGLTTKMAVYPDIENTDEVPDALMDDWGIRGIMELALADLKGDNDQPWSDPKAAELHMTTYKRALGESRRQTFNKRKSGDLRVRARWFA